MFQAVGVRLASCSLQQRCYPLAGACHQHGAPSLCSDPFAQQALCEDGKHSHITPGGRGAKKAQSSAPSFEARMLRHGELEWPVPSHPQIIRKVDEHEGPSTQHSHMGSLPLSGLARDEKSH